MLFRTCESCNGTGTLVLLKGLLVDARLKESFWKQKCGLCGGSGKRPMRAELCRDARDSQRHLRKIYQQAS